MPAVINDGDVDLQFHRGCLALRGLEDEFRAAECELHVIASHEGCWLFRAQAGTRSGLANNQRGSKAR